MESLASAGKALRLGVSNVSLAQLRTLFEGATVKPVFVQNRCYARSGWDREVRAFCRASGIVYQGFSLLTANSRELESRPMKEIARRTKRSPAELLFGFALHVGMLPLTGTSRETHMRLDLSTVDLNLDPSDVNAIERLSG
jgi:diketogulonate reductase-like aldo/keto reductase